MLVKRPQERKYQIPKAKYQTRETKEIIGNGKMG
jgi:hypothetical protein